MKKSTGNFEDRVPKVKINKALNKYSDKVLFPEKVQKAKEAFERLGIPGAKKEKG